MALKKLKNKKIERQQEIIQNAKTAKRELTEEEQQELNGLQKEIDTLQTVIEMTDSREGEKGEERQEEGKRDVEMETKRCLEITELGRTFDVDVESYIRENVSVEKVREDIIKKMMEEKKPVGARSNADILV